MLKHLPTPLLLLTLAASPPTKPTTTTAPSGDFLVTGTVTDDAGNPVASAIVSARCGTHDQLIRTGTAKSDKLGRYSLPFEPGVHYERELGQPIVGIQLATISVSKPGYSERNLARHGDLAMTDDPPSVKRHAARDFAGVVHIHEPYRLDFVLSKTASIVGTLLDTAGQPVPNLYISLTGPDLPPMQPTLTSTKTDTAGQFRLKEVPTGYSWTFQIRDRFYEADITTTPFKLESPEPTPFTLTYDKEKHTLSSAPNTQVPIPKIAP
jgi:hypothetical protein